MMHAHNRSARIDLCADWVLPVELDDQARLIALRKNRRNLIAAQPGAPLQLAGDIRKFWQPGTVLHVRFLGGEPSLQAKVEHYANQWMQHANLAFVFDDSPYAQIRVAFMAGAGSMSMVGVDALLIDPEAPTMNLDPIWFENDPGDVVLRRTVLHEFGHALGLIHEHQSPKSRIQWDIETVKAVFGRPPMNWTLAEIQHNILDRASATWTNASEFDSHSIMLYPIPPYLTKDGTVVPWNDDLSDTDKALIAQIYPA